MYYISNWRDMNDLINGSRNDRKHNHSNELHYDHEVHFISWLSAIISVTYCGSSCCNKIESCNVNIKVLQIWVYVAYPIVVSPMISIKFYPPNLLQGIPCRKTTEDQIVLIVALTENYPNTRDKVEQVKEPKQSW